MICFLNKLTSSVTFINALYFSIEVTGKSRLCAELRGKFLINMNVVFESEKIVFVILPENMLSNKVKYLIT